MSNYTTVDGAFEELDATIIIEAAEIRAHILRRAVDADERLLVAFGDMALEAVFRGAWAGPNDDWEPFFAELERRGIK